MAAIIDRNLWNALSCVLDAAIIARIAASLLIAGLAAALTTLAPVFLAQLVDILSERAVAASAITLAALYVGAQLAGRCLGHLQAHLLAVSDQALQRRMSQLTFARYLGLPMNFHLDAQAGALVQTHNHALHGVRMIVGLICASLAPVAVQVTIILAVVGARFDPAIGIIMLATIIAYAAAFSWGVHRSIRPTGAALARQLDAAALFSEGLMHVETIKNHTAESRIIRSYGVAVLEVERAWNRFFARRLETSVIVTIVFGASMACAISLSLSRFQEGKMSAGDILLVTTFMLQIIGPLETSGYAIRDLAQSASHLSGWSETVNRASEERRPKGRNQTAAEIASASPEVSFEQVSLSYGSGRQAISDISFKIAAGASVAVVGATGAGKTSLVRLLQCHVMPDTGRILVDGRPILDIGLSNLRDRIGVVSQEVALFNSSLRFNLTLGREGISDEDILAALRAVHLGDMIAAFPTGLDTNVGDRGLRLSGGERQRIAIARAILRGGDILLLDEPTSALDPRTEKNVCRDLVALTAGRTTLIVTHRLALAAAAQSIIVLHNGEIVERGDHQQLIARSGLYRELWATQMEVSD